jgi:hypothetical protein
MLKQFDGPARVNGILMGFSDQMIDLETEENQFSSHGK